MTRLTLSKTVDYDYCDRETWDELFADDLPLLIEFLNDADPNELLFDICGGLQGLVVAAEWVEEGAAAPAPPGWISVTERLPESDTGVWVYDANEPAGACAGICHYDPEAGIKPSWSDAQGWPLEAVTHWQPLPEPPVKREEGGAG